MCGRDGLIYVMSDNRYYVKYGRPSGNRGPNNQLDGLSGRARSTSTPGRPEPLKKDSNLTRPPERLPGSRPSFDLHQLGARGRPAGPTRMLVVVPAELSEHRPHCDGAVHQGLAFYQP